MYSNRLLIIGISGVTCGGKTTLAMTLGKILPHSTVISQDDYFLEESDPRQTWIPNLNHVNYDILSSLDMEKMEKDIKNCLRGKNYEFSEASEIPAPGTFTNLEELQKYLFKVVTKSGINILIIEGFCIFNYKPLLPLFHLQFYLTLNKDECEKRRLTRTYEPPDCPGYFEQCVWPEYLKQLKDVQETVEGVKYFDENSNHVLETVLLDVLKYIPVR